jgi:glycosyltransferase involved in cell wall biosynthesis
MPVAICVGQLSGENEFDVVVKGWLHVAREFPQARLWLIGDGPQRDHLYRLVRRSELIGQVLLPGTFDSVEDVLQAADLLVSPTTSSKEPLSVLEAMSVGLPVLASDSVGHRELVTHGTSGFLFPGKDPRALANAIANILNNPHQASQLAMAATQHVRQHRSLRDMAMSHLRLFQQLVHSSVRSVS